MKFVRGISLFFILPVLIFMLGLFLGGQFSDFFYPGGQPIEIKEEEEASEVRKVQFRAAAATEEQVIDADTIYIVEEADLRRDTCIEMETKLPEKYIGMNRDEFVKAMEDYQLAPPLMELERGFVSVEVKTFSREKVRVRMNYVYAEPTNSFYLMAENHYVIVYCEDKKTIYMKTNILLESLPEEVQQKVILGMQMEGEENLYDFLESYSS